MKRHVPPLMPSPSDNEQMTDPDQVTDADSNDNEDTSSSTRPFPGSGPAPYTSTAPTTHATPPTLPYKAYSSPIRHVVDSLHEVSQERVRQLYHPMSSPIKGLWRQGFRAGRFNKHDRMKEARHRHRQHQLSERRDHTLESQDYETMQHQLELEAREHGLELLPELGAHELLPELETNELTPEEIEQLELEEYLRLEQMELEAMLENLEIA